MKIFLAGTYCERKNRDLIEQSKYLLESFYYIKDWQINGLRKHQEFLLDSGAFTFCAGKDFSAKNFEEYIERYADFINRNNVDKFFELDIESVTGYEKVLEYRKRLERLTNKQCIPVWHIDRGKDEFLRHCEEYKFVSLGGYVAAMEGVDKRRRAYTESFPWFISEAHKRGAKIHGLGFTSLTGLEKYHFDSVDSTSWKCERFGRVNYFDGKTLRNVDRRSKGYKVVSNGNAARHNIGEWLKFQKWAETHL